MIPKIKKFRKPNLGTIHSQFHQYLLMAIIIGGTAAICAPLSYTENYHVVSFILLFVVSILSTFLGVGPILLAATTSALVWNFFFIPPHLTFHIEKTEDILIFGLFFIIALVNGILTTRIRHQEQLAREREKHTNALFQLTKELSKASGITHVLKVAGDEIQNHFSPKPFFILQDGNNQLSKNIQSQNQKTLSNAEFENAQWVFSHQQKAGMHTKQTLNSSYTYFPLTGNKLNPGVMAIETEKPIWEEQKSTWDTFLSQISNALEREFLGEMAQKVRFLDESDRLYKTLFNSISHELRIPVATIMGASDSILNSVNPEQVQSALCHEIFTASLRLNRLIENLLNISRLESGHISVRLDWYDINDLFNKLAEDLTDEMKPFSLFVNVPDDMPLVKIDFGLMHQALYNLLFNASQYAPAASEIILESSYGEGFATIKVADQGPGFGEDDLKSIFKKFFRVNGTKTGGLGLGLSIVKGFVEAHNGIITVENRQNGGALFIIRIPMEKPEISTFSTQNDD